MRPRSSSNSGCSPSRSAIRCIAVPSALGRDPRLVLEGGEGAEQRRRQHTAEVGDHRADRHRHVVAAARRCPTRRPRRGERTSARARVGPSPSRTSTSPRRSPASRNGGDPGSGPELDPDPSGSAAGVVLGRQQRLGQARPAPPTARDDGRRGRGRGPPPPGRSATSASADHPRTRPRSAVAPRSPPSRSRPRPATPIPAGLRDRPRGARPRRDPRRVAAVAASGTSRVIESASGSPSPPGPGSSRSASCTSWAVPS